MSDIKTTVLTVDTGGAITNLKEYKQHIDDLKGLLLGLEKGTEEYNKVADELRAAQQKLNEVMDVTRGRGEAVEGSYDNLVKKMSELKQAWRATADEAERADLGQQILDINNQLKGFDASIGNFQRNVGDYGNAFENAFRNIAEQISSTGGVLGSVAGNLNKLLPVIKSTTKAATAGLSGVKKALVSTGIGALVVAVGLLVAHWEDLLKLVKGTNPEMDKLKNANEDLNAAFKEQNRLLDNQITIWNAQGKSTREVNAEKKKLIKTQLVEIQTTIEETKASIASMKAHSWLRRVFSGENKDIKELEESLKKLEETEVGLTQSLEKLDVEDEADREKQRKEKYDEEKKQLDDLIQSIEDRSKTEKEKLTERYEKNKALLEKYHKDTKKLTEQYNEDMEAIDRKANEEKEKIKQEELATISSIEKKINDSGKTDKELKIQELDEQFAKEKALYDKYGLDTTNLTAYYEGLKTKIEDEEQKKRKEQRDKELAEEQAALVKRRETILDFSTTVASILGTLGDAWAEQIESEVESGKISEKEGKKQFERIKALQIAEAVINTVAGAVGAFMGITKDTGGWGIALAAAQAAAVTAAGYAQIEKIRRTKIGDNSKSEADTYASVTPTVNEYQPNYSANLTNNTELSRYTNAMNSRKLYVSVTDIESVENTVKARDEESTY